MILFIARIINVPMASKVINESVVTYANEAKIAVATRKPSAAEEVIPPA